MNTFDKVCAASGFVLGVALLVLGGFGVFGGCQAQFTLPPILGVMPAIVGWGVVRAVYIAWSARPGAPPSTAGRPESP